MLMCLYRHYKILITQSGFYLVHIMCIIVTCDNKSKKKSKSVELELMIMITLNNVLTMLVSALLS